MSGDFRTSLRFFCLFSNVFASPSAVVNQVTSDNAGWSKLVSAMTKKLVDFRSNPIKYCHHSCAIRAGLMTALWDYQRNSPKVCPGYGRV
jgi:hypothetical protein